MDGNADALLAWIAAESQRSVPASVLAAADAIRRRHERAAIAVLYYGSCLRREGDPAEDEGCVLDFYVVVDRYRNAYRGAAAAIANTLLPPNVYYLEVPWQGRTLRAKYAVIALAQFRRGTSRRSFLPTLWSRFSQPVRLVLVRDAAARDAVLAALRDAMATMVERIVPLLGGRFTTAELWLRGFRESYRTELRAEGPARARLLFEASRDRYERLTPAALTASGFAWTQAASDGRFVVPAAESAPARRRAGALWAVRRVTGKLLNLLRLIKAVFTFDGGVDYVLWKVARHSGVRVAVTPWQHRHPLLSAPVLAWRLYRRGAFR